MPSFEEAVAQLRGAEAAGFGFSESHAAKLINQGVRDYAARSEWIRALLNLGPAVADQARYSLPAHVVKIKRLRVGEGRPYERQDIETLWELQAGTLVVAPGCPGVFIPEYDEDGTTRYVTLHPTPDSEQAGEAITALASIVPAADLSGSDAIPFPQDAWRGVLSAAKAIAYEDTDENPQQGGYFREAFNSEAEELRRRANSRVGGGPTKFPVAGHRR